MVVIQTSEPIRGAREESDMTTTLACVALGILAWLFVIAWVAVLVPRWGKERSGAFFWLCAVALACILIWIMSRQNARLDRGVPTGRLIWIAWVSPVFGTASLLYLGVRSAGMPAIAMNNDMVWNTAQALFVHSDGGVLPESHPNPAPLTNVLFALAYGPQGEVSLRTVFVAQFLVIVAAAFLASLVSGLFVFRSSAGAAPLLRSLLTVMVGWAPYGGVVLGSVFSFGHVNVLLSYLVMWLIWIVFSEGSRISRIAGCSIGVTILLALWAPLIVFPISLLIVSILHGGRWRNRGLTMPRREALNIRVAIVGTLSLVQMAVYLLLVTAPDLGREGGALAAEGASLPFSRKSALALLFVILLGLAVAWFMSPASRSLRDKIKALLLATVFGLAACGYLVYQRHEASATLWGYYPIKFFAIYGIVLAGIVATILGEVAAGRKKCSGRWSVGALAMVLLFVAAFAPLSWNIRFGTVAPGIAQGREETEIQTEDIRQLVQVHDAQTDEAAFFLDWNGPLRDSFVNRYLIQLSTQRSTDPARRFAYYFDPSSDSDLCALLTAWDRDVTIYARSGGTSTDLGERLKGCTLSYSIIVKTELPE